MRSHFYLILFFLLLTTGCASEFNLATQKEETTLYGTEKEVKIGEAFSASIEKQYKMVNDVDVNDRVDKILDRLVEVCDRRDIVYFVKVIDDKIVNAASLPGGYVYIFKGLVDKIKTDDQLAAVIAHELGHITARHGIKRLQASYGALLLQIASMRTNAAVAGGVNLALASMFTEYSQQDEFQADELSVKYLKKAGYDPQGAPQALEILRKEQEKEPIREYSYWKTHPNLSKRIAAANKAIAGKLEFKEYLNLMGD